MTGKSVFEHLFNDILALETNTVEIFRHGSSDLQINYEKMSLLFNHSKKTNDLFFILENGIILFYEDCLSISHIKTHTNQGQMIPKVNPLVDSLASLTDKWLRNFFVLFEFLIFKTVHLGLRNQCPNYRMEGGCNNDTLHDRIKELAEHGIITTEDKKILIAIKHVRNLFAHSINNIQRIKYQGLPLEVSFGARGKVKTSKVEHFFLDDAFDATNKLIKSFKDDQAKQIDKNKLIEGIRTLESGQLITN